MPQDYKYSIAFKKTSQGIAKFVAGLIVGTSIGKTISPDHVKAVEGVVATMTMAGLEFVHDWARMKWPDKKWL